MLRVIASIASPLNLHFDEAQYWAWSRTLDWGYFSKPPLVAWAIAFTTGLFGNEEWAVRLAAPLAHGAGAAVLYALTRRLYGEAAAFWAGAGWLLLPGVWLSAAIISTDALLLPLWAAALYALFRVLDGGGWRWAAALGLFVGLGALAKYAMLYFLLCAGLAAIVSRQARAALVSRDGLLALGVMTVILTPNLIWNANNGFATVTHTAANANLSGRLFNPGEMFEFLGSQAGVIGPVLLIALFAAVWRFGRRFKETGDTERILLAFVLPPLVIILTQAFLSRAHANWAAAAYPATVVLLAGWLAASRAGRRTLLASTAINAVAGIVFVVFAVFPPVADAMGSANAFKRARGWDIVCAETAARAAAAPEPYSAILTDHRALFFALSYYCRPQATDTPLPPLRMWVMRADPENHAALTAPMTTADDAHVLVVHMSELFADVLAADFTVATPLDAMEIDLGGGRTRWLAFSDASGFAPAERDAAFLQRLSEREQLGPSTGAAPAVRAPSPPSAPASSASAAPR